MMRDPTNPFAPLETSQPHMRGGIMNKDYAYWLQDAAQILRENGSIQHAVHVNEAAGKIALLIEALVEAEAAVTASYHEAHAEWRRQEKRGEACNKIVREWRSKARTLLAKIGGEP